MTQVADPILRGDAERTAEACAGQLARLGGAGVLVTGATGFIGGSIVDALLAFNAGAKHPCRILLPVRSTERAVSLRPEFASAAGVRMFEWRADRALELPEQCRFVIHAAAPTDSAIVPRAPLAAALETAELTRRVVDVAKQHAVESLLFVSSGAVYGPQPPEIAAIPESYDRGPRSTDPLSAYGETKRYCEMLCALSGTPARAARLFACIGPRQSLAASFAVPDFFRQALDARLIRIRSDGKAMRTFCYVSDVVTALLKALTRLDDAGQPFNVGAEAPVVSIAEVARMIAAAVGEVRIVVEGSAPDLLRSRYVPDITQMKRLHSPQVGLEEAIQRLATFHRSRRQLARAAASPAA